MAHTSTVKKGEPKWGTVNKTKLPDSAFADRKNRKYPHHWVSGGVMYLHRGGLAVARAAAEGARWGGKAPAAVKAHLAAHAKAIGMGDKKKKTKQSEGIHMETLQIDVNALHIMDQINPEFEFSESADGVRKFRMVGYSGKVIKGHWWWGNLAIDLGGGTFKKAKFPILRDHITSMEMGFTKKPRISNEEGLVFTEKEVTFLENEDVNKFVENSKKGFPYQASISARPTVVERVEEGASVKVNGQTLKGPGTVWRKWDFRECSICVFGYDEQTTAQVFHQSGQHVDIEIESVGLKNEQIKNETEVFNMDLNRLKEEHPEEYEALMAEATETAREAAEATLTEGFQTQLAEKDRTISSLSADKDNLSENLQKTEGRVLSLEKKDTLRTEADLDHLAGQIWQTALAKSGLPEWLYEKVQKHVQRGTFTKEGVFDKVAFTEAVTAEIADWESHGSPSVEGFALTVRDSEEEVPDKFKGDAIVDRMLGYVGQSKAAH